jgi:diguanylate cyclase (GGDEF)-like protein
MSMLPFRKRRGAVADPTAPLEDRRDALRKALRDREEAGPRRGGEGGGLPAVGDAVAQALRLLRLGLGADDETGTALSALERQCRAARAPADFEDLAEKLRALRPEPRSDAAQGASRLAGTMLRATAQHAMPVARGLALRGALADLRSLLRVESIGSIEDRPFRRLVRVLETVAVSAARTRDANALVKACLGELIDTLAHLDAGEGEAQARLQRIRGRLQSARELRDLEELRRALLDSAEDLVAEARGRQRAVQEAVATAKESQARAQELEAALCDAAEAARTDALTGLGNRRALDDAVERAGALGHDVAVLALDLDLFKKVNDERGHAAGDEVLRFTADLVRGEIRGDDHAFRVGGEEFVVLLPQGTWQGARTTAERLRSRISRELLSVPDGDPIGVTVSIGLTLWQPGSGTFADALAAADEALYRAKEGGRNRVVG